MMIKWSQSEWTRTCLAWCFLLFFSACGRDWVATNPGPCVYDSECLPGYRCINTQCVKLRIDFPDGGVHLKEFGERCAENEECQSSYCLAHPEGAFCTQLCTEGCPGRWECKQVPDPHGGPQTVGLCTVAQNRLCAPCSDDRSCNLSGSDLCMTMSDGRYCAMDCTYSSCPTGYGCRELTTEKALVHQCLPNMGTCLCSAQTAGMVRSCEQKNQLGTCTGYEECDAKEGWKACTAKIPQEESCNGQDDNCNGFVDEGLPEDPCSQSNELGTCLGKKECRGLDGWRCSAQVPTSEACDGADNDCDGQTDEDFVDAQGRYFQDTDCGSCGANCAKMIPHALSSRCQLVEEQPRCRTASCEVGYFPYADGAICMALPANLCAPCSSDSDCLAPASRCVMLGPESFCGRDCSSNSPYGAGCPAGYQCQTFGSDLQCQPQSGTCLCSPETLGAIRSCQIQTCTGFQTCSQNGANYQWSACNIDAFNVEICDGLDNNCNGQIDEGFLNPATGRYEGNANCGFCNNDCSRYWFPQIDHTTGMCYIASVSIPQCVMGPCLTETVGTVDYEWVDVNGDSKDGCECRRVLGNTSSDPPDLIEEPIPGLIYADENCDGIDGVITDALFVRAGSQAGDGTLSRPFATISEALAAFFTSGKSYVLVAQGTYNEEIELRAGMKLHGGYAADFLTRDVVLYATMIQGRQPQAAVRASAIAGGSTVLSGFIIRGHDVDQSSVADRDGESSTAVSITDCDASLVLRSNVIVGGRGQDGGAGSSGEAGYGRQVSTQFVDATAGQDGQRLDGNCPNNQQQPGGRAGTNPSCVEANGQPGGATHCPSFDWNAHPVQGTQEEYQSNANGNGLGGYDWSFDSMSGSSCTHATESGYPSNIQLNVGQDGQDGADGSNGHGGLGGTGVFGSVGNNGWVAAPQGAMGGQGGVSGRGGGGGGGGGGTAAYFQGSDHCPMYEIGPSGGGGGAAGCAGEGGAKGRAGGASIAILVSAAAANSGGPAMRYNYVQRGLGGRGGNGGFGGMGGLGGNGGMGGNQPDWISSQGGKGGNGGNGGPGGGGGGGAGGPSYGILTFNVSTDAYLSSNRFAFDESVSTSGVGGDGGASVGTEASGAPGARGFSSNIFGLFSCSAGACPANFSCDPNQVCIPNPSQSKNLPSK